MRLIYERLSHRQGQSIRIEANLHRHLPTSLSTISPEPPAAMPLEIDGINASEVHEKIGRFLDGMLNIKGTTDEFLIKLNDGRVIDAEGWND